MTNAGPCYPALVRKSHRQVHRECMSSHVAASCPAGADPANHQRDHSWNPSFDSNRSSGELRGKETAHSCASQHVQAVPKREKTCAYRTHKSCPRGARKLLVVLAVCAIAAAAGPDVIKDLAPGSPAVVDPGIMVWRLLPIRS